MDKYSFISENGTIREIADIAAREKNTEQDARLSNLETRRDVYSLTEVRTGGIWIDGKPIYRIVKDAGAMVSNLDFDVSDLNIDTLVRTDVLGADDAGYTGRKWCINSVSNNDDRICYMKENNHIVTTGRYYKRWIIIEYTKKP